MTAWVNRGIYNFLAKGFKLKILPLSLMELQEAEIYHLKKSQVEPYTDEYTALSKSMPITQEGVAVKVMKRSC